MFFNEIVSFQQLTFKYGFTAYKEFPHTQLYFFQLITSQSSECNDYPDVTDEESQSGK